MTAAIEAVRAPHGAWRRDPLLLAAIVAAVLLAIIWLAPPPSPRALLSSPPSLDLVVADLRGHALTIVNTADPSRARRIALPGGPHEIAALPDGRLAVSLEQFASIAIVDTASGAVQALEVGGTPHGLAVTGDTLYVTDRSVNAIRRFTIGTWAEQSSIASGSMPHIVEARRDGSLAIANAADHTLTLGARAIPVSHVPESIAVGADGRAATAGSVGGTLHIFDASGVLVAEHEVGGRPVRLRYAPSGRVLAAALSADGTVALVEDGVVRRVAVGGVPDGLAFSSDGRWLYAGDMYGGAVSVIDVARSRVVQRFEGGGSAGALLVLPRR